jgi:hypothetical protein
MGSNISPTFCSKKYITKKNYKKQSEHCVLINIGKKLKSLQEK